MQFRDKGQHRREIEAAAFALTEELQGGGNLARMHDNARLNIQRMKVLQQELILHRITVEENHGFTVQTAEIQHFLFSHMVVFCHTKAETVSGQHKIF